MSGKHKKVEHACKRCGKRGTVPNDMLWTYTVPAQPRCVPRCEEARG